MPAAAPFDHHISLRLPRSSPYKQYRFHQGVDLRAHHDTVYAIAGGTASIGFNHLIGLYVRITDGQFYAVYGHLSTILANEQVAVGDPIGITGATGRVTVEHLHLSVSYHGRPLDPLAFLYQIMIKNNNHEQLQTPERTSR